jgi:hypothetical protein
VGSLPLLSYFVAKKTITCRMASIHSCISFSESAANTTVLRTAWCTLCVHYNVDARVVSIARARVSSIDERTMCEREYAPEGPLVAARAGLNAITRASRQVHRALFFVLKWSTERGERLGPMEFASIAADEPCSSS